MSHAANQGYSHLSGIDMMSNASKCLQPALRPLLRDAGGGGCVGSPVEPAGDVVGEQLLAPQHPRERLAHDVGLVGGRRRGRELGVELVGLAACEWPSMRSKSAHGEVVPPAGRSRSRSSTVAPGATVTWYQNDALVPRASGLTVSAPETTWSLMPSLGYAGDASDPNRRRALVSFSQNSSAGRAAVRAGVREQLQGTQERVLGGDRVAVRREAPGVARRRPSSTCCGTRRSAGRGAWPRRDRRS